MWRSRCGGAASTGFVGRSPPRSRTSRTVAGERPVARATSRSPAAGLSLIIAAACCRLVPLSSGRSRSSLPSLVFDCGVFAVERPRVLDAVLSGSAIGAATARSDRCGWEVMMRAAAAVGLDEWTVVDATQS